MSSIAFEPELVASEPDHIQGVRNGEGKALAALYREHQACLCSFAARFLADPVAAEDLVHDVFMILPRVIHRYDQRASLKAFLLGIASRRALHHLRTARRRRGLLERFAQLSPYRNVATPEDHASQRRLADSLTAALDRLSFEHRVVFTLCDIEELSSDEVSEALGVPAGTVRSRLFTARHKVRALLAKAGAL